MLHNIKKRRPLRYSNFWTISRGPYGMVIVLDKSKQIPLECYGKKNWAITQAFFVLEQISEKQTLQKWGK